MYRHLLFILILASTLAGPVMAQIIPPPSPRLTDKSNTAAQNTVATGQGAGTLAGIPFSDEMIPRDNIAGSYILQEVGHLRPIIARGNVLITVNQEGGTLVAFRANPLQKLIEVPIGLGANSVYEHPNRPFEIWITDSISNCVTVFDPTTLTIGQTVRTHGSPHSLVFSADGSRAYVTCSSGRTIDVIDTSTFTVVNSIPLQMRRPRGAVRVGDNLHVVPFLSGNNTAALEAGASNFPFVLSLPPLATLGVNPLPDIDLQSVGVNPAAANFEMLNPALEWTALGTVLFNVQNRPGTTELWVCNTDALNAEVIAEPNFVDGQVVRNRVSIFDLAAGPSAPVNHVDLDAISGGVGCAQPRGVAFDTQRQRVYVMCEGGDLIAVLDNSGNWVGYYRLQGQNGIRCLPQGAVVVGDELFVFNKGTNSLTTIDLVNTPLNSTVSNHASLGFTPLTDAVRRGRSIIHNAELSLSKTSSCASCHVDGDLDGVVWDLSGVLDPQGTPNNQLTFWIDRKGAMVTQSLNGLPEGAPYHWRGERKDLEAFNVAFEGLLDGTQLNTTDLADMVAYINELHYPANPEQQDDRVTTPDELEGARIFLQELATGGATCNDCHSLPLGSNNEPIRVFGTGFAPATEVAQLRNIADKELGKHNLGSFAGFSLGDSSEIGPSLTHAGTIATLFDFSLAFVNIDSTEAMRLEDFMRAFDTGLAPATAIQATMTPANVLNFPELALLMSEADQGECDLVASGSISFTGLTRTFTAWYNPATQLFEMEAVSYGQLPASTFTLFVSAGYGSWTFRGVPVGTGRRIIDTDLDGLGNDDEMIAGTDPENPDSDGDSFPDGYEITWGMDPNVPDLSSPDTQAPAIVLATPLFATTNTVKIDVETDETCVVTASWNGLRGPEMRTSPKFAPYAKRHQFVINFLPENAATTVTFVATDPNGNASTMVMNLTTAAEVGRDVHIDSINTATGPISIIVGGGQATTVFTASVLVKDHLGVTVPKGYDVTAFIYFEDASGQLQVIDSAAMATTNSQGVATFSTSLVWGSPVGTPGSRKVYFGVSEIRPAPGSGLGNAYTEANDVVNFLSHSF